MTIYKTTRAQGLYEMYNEWGAIPHSPFLTKVRRKEEKENEKNYETRNKVWRIQCLC